MPETGTFPEAAFIDIDNDTVRDAIREEYSLVASAPDGDFHFHTGRKLIGVVGYLDEWLEGIPEPSIESFAGTGNPFSMGVLKPGENVVDVGCGAGIDSLIAAKMVGPEGHVVGIDMTPEMIAKARAAAKEAGITNVEFLEGYMEELPIPDGWADVVISNGVFNLTPNKPAAIRQMFRVLKPGGRLQVADIMVEREVSAAAKQKIDLWTG